MSMADRSSVEAGARRYEAMTNAEKARLAAQFREDVSGNEDWSALVKKAIADVVARRAQLGESLDAADITAEVISLVKPHIGAEAREGLFRKIATMLPSRAKGEVGTSLIALLFSVPVGGSTLEGVMRGGTAVSHRDLAQRIREGNQKRQEEQRRLNALRHAFEESVLEERRAKDSGGPTAYLPIILVFLLFVSFPLSEQIVDWYLVGFFCLLNSLYAALVSELSHWMNVLTIILSNLILVRLSPYLYDIPALMLKLQLLPTVLYLLTNVFLAAFLYYGYVQQRFLFRPRVDVEELVPKDVGTPMAAAVADELNNAAPLSPGGSGSRGSKQRGITADAAALRAFVLETERTWRADVAASVILLFNIAALAYTGVLPREVVAQTVRNVFRIIS